MEKDIERTEEQWNENEPPTTDFVRKAIEKLKNNNRLYQTIYSRTT